MENYRKYYRKRLGFLTWQRRVVSTDHVGKVSVDGQATGLTSNWL